MVMKLKHRILFCVVINLILLILLYCIPIGFEETNSICVFKNLTGKDCWNCGMTRAFLAILRLNFKQAYQYNHKVIIVFPLTVGIYLYSWCKYILKKRR